MADKHSISEMTPETVMDALKTLSSIEQKMDKVDALDKSVKENVANFMAQQEEKSQKLTLELEKKDARIKDLEDRHAELEKALSRPAAGGDADGKYREEIKALNQFLRSDASGLSDVERKYLRTDSDTDGGFLVPDALEREIIKDITEISPIRQVARVKTSFSGRIQIPTRTGLVTVYDEAEGEETESSNSTYGQEYIPLHRIMVNVSITAEELADSAFNMENEIRMDVAEAFAKREGLRYVKGSGVKSPEGFMTNTDVATTNSGVADNITMDSLKDLAGALKTGYNGVYFMTRLTITEVSKLKTGEGQYLWQAGNIAAGIPNLLNGYRYIETPDMDEVGTNTFPVAFADLRRGYMIADRAALSVIRDPYSQKKKGLVDFTFMRRHGGQVIQPEAIKKLKCAV